MELSLVTQIFETLRIDPPSKLILLDAHEFSARYFPPTPPDADTLILQIEDSGLAGNIKKILLAVYPGGHEVTVVNNGKKAGLTLDELESNKWSNDACLYIPSLGEGTSFESFAEIVAHLRAPDGCPWDREQTHRSLRKHLLEESYEVLTAMDANDIHAMGEEFGDLLLQIVLNAQIAHENGDFSIRNLIESIYDKIVRRHPHVFGDVEVDGVDGVLANWEKLKEKERGKKVDYKGILDGVPAALPALSQAQEYQDRAARVGFDWVNVDGVLDKIREEVEEIKNAETDFELASEFGDLLFALVNFARWKNLDSESALRGANEKFKKRFSHVEQSASRTRRTLSDLSLEEMETYWQESKQWD